MPANLRFICCLWIGALLIHTSQFSKHSLGQASDVRPSIESQWHRPSWYVALSNPFGNSNDSALSRAAEIRTLGNEANRNIRKLPAILPRLVEAIEDSDILVRSTASKSLRQLSLNLQRRIYAYRDIGNWAELEPQFREAYAKLTYRPSMARDQREIERLLALDPPNYAKRRQIARTKSKVAPPTERFLDGFYRFDEDQVTEMWQYLNVHFDKVDAANQKAILRELVRSASPRFLELLLIASDRYDDRVLEIVLESDYVESPVAATWLLFSATPSESSVRTLIATQACKPSINDEIRAGLIQCLCNSAECEPNVISQMVQAYIATPRCDWLPDCFDLVVQHKSAVRPSELRTIVRYAHDRLANESLDAWERGQAATTLGELLPGDPSIVEAVVREIVREMNRDSELCISLLHALSCHGVACKMAHPHLIHLAKSDDNSLAEASLQVLAQTHGLDLSTVEYLVERLSMRDLDVTYKIAAAKVLAANATAALPLLRKAIVYQYHSDADGRCLVDLICAAELLRQHDDEMDKVCQRIADDHSVPADERLAAWHARGVCATQTNLLAAQVLACLRDRREYNEIKGAALQTLATATGNCAIPLISEYTHHEDPVLACAARFAYHMAGESNTAVYLLLGLLPSEMEDTIELAIRDIGLAGKKALLETLDSPTASDTQRQIAFRTLVSANPVEWDKLLGYVEKDEDGDAFAKSLRMAWNFDDSVVPALFRKLEKLPSDSIVTKRLWSLADDFTDGLGAAGDEQDWSPSAIRQSLVKSAKQSSSRAAESPAATPSIAAAAPAMAATAPATAAPSAPRAAPPSKKVVETSAAPTIVPPPEGIRKVDVFYGTNRQVNRLSMFGSRLRWGAFGVALGCTMFCIVGFAKRRAIVYAIVALVGLMGLTAMARDSLDMAFWFPNRTKIYSGEYSDEIKLGVCQVTIPKNHVPGELESPSFLLRMEVKWDPEKHIVLTNTQPLEREEFYSQLHSCMDRSGKNLLVFVHGYNVSFEDAARRTAQMASDLEFPGAPVFFSWPSHNDWYRYPDDAENIQASVNQIRSFLEQIARESKAESINLVAHSMGSVGLTQALAGLSDREPVFNQVVLAAPDIDATVFREEIAPKITKTAKRVTLYTSQTDLALLASRYFNAGDRVGDSSRGVLSIPGIEVIDATEIDSSLLGHSYYGSNIQVLDDIANLFRNKALTDRKYLEYQADATPPHWSFSPQYRSATRPASPGAVR